jgi:hypothetical protein
MYIGATLFTLAGLNLANGVGQGFIPCEGPPLYQCSPHRPAPGLPPQDQTFETSSSTSAVHVIGIAAVAPSSGSTWPSSGITVRFS